MGQVRWLLLGIATLGIAAGIAVAIVSVGGSDEPGTTASENASRTAPDDASTLGESVNLEITRADGDGLEASSATAEEAATLSESAVVETTKANGGGPDASSIITSDTAGLTESVEAETAKAGGSGLDAGTLTATLDESAEVVVDRAEPPPSGGGRGTNPRVEDNVRFIVRDSAGKIKEQGIAK